MPQALAEERRSPLQIQIPSIPARNLSVDVVDNNLPVHLLDAQVESIRHAQPPPQAPPSAPPVASGQFVLGTQSETNQVRRRINTNSAPPPAVVMAGTRKAAPAQAPNQRIISPAQPAPQTQQFAPPPLPYATTSNAAASGSSGKSFLNYFALEQPKFLSNAEMPRNANPRPPAERAPSYATLAATKPRVTAIMPEAPQQPPQATAASAPVAPVRARNAPANPAPKAAAAVSAPAATPSRAHISNTAPQMAAIASVVQPAPAPTSAPVVLRHATAKATPQIAANSAPVAAPQPQPVLARAPAPARKPAVVAPSAPQIAQGNDAQENSERLAKLSASLADTTESLARSINALSALTNAAVVDASKQAAPKAANLTAEPVATTAQLPPSPEIIANAAAADRYMQQEEQAAQQIQQPQQITQLPTLDQAKQAFADPYTVQGASGYLPPPAAVSANMQMPPAVETQAIAPPPQIAQLPSIEEATQAYASAAIPPAPEVREVSPVEQAQEIPAAPPIAQIGALPTLEEAKQAFAAQPPFDSRAAITTKQTFGTVVEQASLEARELSAIEPAVGVDQAQINQAVHSEIAPVRSGLVLEEVGGGASPVDLRSVQKPPQDDALSAQSEKMLKRVPSKIDTPKNVKQERLDIERERVTSSVFSELDGASDNTDDNQQPLDLTIDVERPSLDMNYELDRAYNALASGQTDIARESYQRVLGVEPNNIQALFGMGALLHRAGDLEAARQYYSKVLAQDPDNRDTLNNFLSLVAEEAPEQALTKLKELESKNPDFSPIPAQISFIYQKLQNMQMAGQYMVKALSLAPNNLTYKYNLAILLDRQGARADAANFYQELVDAYLRGESIPGNIASIQERLTFIRSNR